MQVQKHLKRSGTPNAYFFTKRMAEVLISSYHSPKFPVAIVRPSLVGCTARAPHPGYFGNNAGPTAVGLAFAVGIATYTSHHVGRRHLSFKTCVPLIVAATMSCMDLNQCLLSGFNTSMGHPKVPPLLWVSFVVNTPVISSHTALLCLPVLKL